MGAPLGLTGQPGKRCMQAEPEQLGVRWDASLLRCDKLPAFFGRPCPALLAALSGVLVSRQGGSTVGQRLVGTAFDGLVELPAEHDLQSVDAYITSQCNRRCTYCFLPSDFFSSGQRMSTEAFSDMVTWCLRHHVGEVTLLGGEPSLHPAFADMAALAHGWGLAVRVDTNGARRF